MQRVAGGPPRGGNRGAVHSEARCRQTAAAGMAAGRDARPVVERGDACRVAGEGAVRGLAGVDV